MCCSFVEFFLYTVNGFFLLAGLGLTAGSSYLLVLHSGGPGPDLTNTTASNIVQQISSEIPTPLIWPLLGIGLICMLVAVLGICGTCGKRSVLGRCTLFFYGAIVVIAVIAELAIGGAMFAWESGANIGDIQQQEQRVLHDLSREIFPKCCNNATKTLIPQPPPQGMPECPVPKGILENKDCASLDALAGGLDTLLRNVVLPVAGAAIGLAVLQLLALIAICCVASMGRRQAAEAEEKRRRGERVDPSEVWLVDSSIYGDSAGGGRDPSAVGKASGTSEYVRF